MRILAIDAGKHCGWATWDGQHLESGVQTFDLKRGESPGMRFLWFRTWLAIVGRHLGDCKVCAGMGILNYAENTNQEPAAHQCLACAGTGRIPGQHVIVYEQPHHRGGHATEVLVGMTTRIQEFAAEIGAEHAAVHTGTLKKWATGNGRAGKADMIEAAKRWLWNESFVPHRDLAAYLAEPMDDNEADALLLLAWARENLEGK